MNLSRFASVLLLSGIILQTACASERIIDVRTNHEVTREEFLGRLSRADEVIVGEKHNTPSIQEAEARLFTDYSAARQTSVTLAWEFWSWSEREKLAEQFWKFRDGQISAEQFQRAVLGEKNPELTYVPLMEAVRAANGQVLATNLTRTEKAPVVQSGIGALDPKLLPTGFEMGGSDYYDRFVLEMEGHGTPAQWKNYFAAQCLVDDVAALHFSQDRETRSAFLVIGEFHTRYFDGVWKRIVARSPHQSRLLVRIAESGDESDWPAVLNHVKYGPVADFVIFTARGIGLQNRQ